MKLSFYVEHGHELEVDEIEDKELAQELQFHLSRIGYPLVIDGAIGPKTIAAWARFKKDRYLNSPEKIGPSSAALLLSSQSIKKGLFLPTSRVGWVSSPFGPRGAGFHRGIDIAANEGVPVHAIADGTVSVAISGCDVGNWKCGGGYGNCVYIEHQRQNFHQTRYAHLSRLASGISTGVAVKSGAVIGYVGNTGHSFGNHLHFETRVDGVAKDPLSFINPIV